MKSRRIYLIGYMTSGKSWLGKELASLTGMEFIDLDELFEERFRVSITDFFAKYGEHLFRQLERELLLQTAGLGQGIISTGGGAPCFSNNMAFVLKSGTSIYLRMQLPDLIKRIRGIRKKRPLLKDLTPSEVAAYVRNQLAEREPYYLQADYIFDGPDYPVEEIVRLLGSL
ncbi:MAG: shikimate kinase [Bacteroidetes bacterium]|nr:MAG: shikimate kinase [Bacteroidota bacterium]